MTEAKIGLNEICGIFLLVLGSKLSDMTPTLLAQHGKNAFWIIGGISFFISILFIIPLLRLLTKLKDKNIVEACYLILGKYIGFFVCLILFVMALALTALDSRTYIDEVGQVYFEQSPIVVLYFIFMATCVYGARRGLSNIGYTAWAIFPYIKIALILLFILSLKETVWLRIFPIFGDGLPILLKEGVVKSSIFGGDILLFLIAFSSIKNPQTFKKGTYISLGVAMVEIVIFYMIYCTIFDYKSIDEIAFPFHELTTFVSIGEFFTNVETFFFGFWIIAGLIRFIVYLYITTWIFTAMFKIQDLTPVLPAISLLVITLGIIPENSLKVLLLYKEYFHTYFTIFCFALPVILWGGGKLRRVL